MKKRENIPLKELLLMKNFFIIADLALLAGCIIYSIFTGFDWRVYFSVLVGNVVSVANFYLMGKGVEQTIRRKNGKKAQFYANASYAARYLGMFAVLAVFLWFRLIELIPSVVPLFFPKLYYLCYHIRHKGEDAE